MVELVVGGMGRKRRGGKGSEGRRDMVKGRIMGWEGMGHEGGGRTEDGGRRREEKGRSEGLGSDYGEMVSHMLASIFKISL
jgi:hypothetical protein